MLPDVPAFIIAFLLKKSTGCDIFNIKSTLTLIYMLLSLTGYSHQTSTLLLAQLPK